MNLSDDEKDDGSKWANSSTDPFTVILCGIIACAGLVALGYILYALGV